jgi:hypothetical protein
MKLRVVIPEPRLCAGSPACDVNNMLADGTWGDMISHSEIVWSAIHAEHMEMPEGKEVACG